MKKPSRSTERPVKINLVRRALREVVGGTTTVRPPRPPIEFPPNPC